jgi:2-oxoglutarate dehydrogenase E1 component
MDVGNHITTLPTDSNFHRLVRKIFDNRHKTITTGKEIEWGTAEALAFATLI